MDQLKQKKAELVSFQEQYKVRVRVRARPRPPVFTNPPPFYCHPWNGSKLF